MGHFYLDNPPRAFYEIEYSDKNRAGEMRSVTIKDARREGAYPSPNEVMNILDKPGLMYWKQQMLAEAVRDVVIEHAGDWDDQGWSDAYNLFKERTEIFSKAGTEIHDMLEVALADPPHHPDPIVDACLDWLVEERIVVTGIEEIVVSPVLGLGERLMLLDTTTMEM